MDHPSIPKPEGDRHLDAHPVEIRRVYPYHPSENRDTLELEIWLNSLPGRLISIAVSPWDGAGLIAVIIEESHS